ncbi:MAG: hypothetical protein ACD_75C01079G0001 [uncultured bacterium]|nr:MAG: hypothetical protein ACD_75C01079G0001 [uncultured bacterium]
MSFIRYVLPTPVGPISSTLFLIRPMLRFSPSHRSRLLLILLKCVHTFVARMAFASCCRTTY